jgi:hypothetical protein
MTRAGFILSIVVFKPSCLFKKSQLKHETESGKRAAFLAGSSHLYRCECALENSRFAFVSGNSCIGLVIGRERQRRDMAKAEQGRHGDPVRFIEIAECLCSRSTFFHTIHMKLR